MPAHLGAQDAEAVFGIVVGDALNQARQMFDDPGCGLISVSSQSISWRDSRNIIVTSVAAVLERGKLAP
jgi:hypothetical protein